MPSCLRRYGMSRRFSFITSTPSTKIWPLVGSDFPGDQPDEGAFSGAAGAYQEHEFPGFDFNIDVFQGDRPPG